MKIFGFFDLAKKDYNEFYNRVIGIKNGMTMIIIIVNVIVLIYLLLTT